MVFKKQLKNMFLKNIIDIILLVVFSCVVDVKNDVIIKHQPKMRQKEELNIFVWK